MGGSDDGARAGLDRLVPRMRPHATSIFGEMSVLAARTGAINLGQGFPDTDGPEALKEAAIEAIREGRGNQYPAVHGIAPLRDAIAAHQAHHYGLVVDPEVGVVVGTGASEIIGSCLLALLDTDDEVIVLEPWFDVYDATVSLARGRRIGVPMRPPGFRPDIDAIRAAVTPRTRMLLLNSPHNPTGTVFTADEVSDLARIAIEHDLIVVSDEAYEHLWFDGHPHIPISTLPGMFERTVTIGSGGKCFSFTGWKVGWATGPADLIAAVRVVRQHLSFVSGGPFQWAMATGLALPDAYFEAFRADLQGKRDRLAAGLADIGLGVTTSQGTYFTVTDVRPLGFGSGLEFARALPERAGVVAIPVEALCASDVGDHWVRWAFCKRPEVLDLAIERLREAFV